MNEQPSVENDRRCLSSAEVVPDVLKRCQRDAGHDGEHYWRETSEGHDRDPLTVVWDDRRRTRVIPPGKKEAADD